MADSATVMVMVNSLAAMTKIFLVFGVGVVCAIYPKSDPLLPVSSLRYLSRLSNIVFIPALIIFSLGSALSADLLGKIGVLILFSLINSGVSFILGATIGKLMHEKDNDDLFTAVYVSIGSPNSISLPIMVMQTLCDSATFNADFDGDSSQCFASANSMMFVYSIGWHLQFWSYAFPLLQTIGNPAIVHENNSVSLNSIVKFCQQFDLRDVKKRDVMKDWVHRVLLTPVFLSIYLGMFIGLISPLRSVLFRPSHALYFVGSAIETVSSPVVCLQSLIMAASLAHGDFSVFVGGYHRLRAKLEGILFPGNSAETTHKVDNKHAVVLSDESFNPVHVHVHVHDQTDTRYVALTTVGHTTNTNSSSSSSLSSESASQTNKTITTTSESEGDLESDATGKHYPENHESEAGALHAGSVVAIELTKPSEEEIGSKLPEWRSVGALIVCRLVLPPVVMIIITLLAVSMGIVGADERMLKVVILIESASPSAQMIIVALNQLRLTDIATQVAFMFLFVYVLSILTITFWTTVGISLYY